MHTFLALYCSIELRMIRFDHTIEIHRNIRDNTAYDTYVEIKQNTLCIYYSLRKRKKRNSKTLRILNDVVSLLKQMCDTFIDVFPLS